MFTQNSIGSQPLRPQPWLQICGITAPVVSLQPGLVPDQSGPLRIQMHVVAGLHQIARAALIDQLPFVAPAEQVPPLPMPPIETLRISAQQPDWVAASPLRRENDCSSGNRHALANHSSDTLFPTLPGTVSDPSRPGRFPPSDRHGSSDDNTRPRIRFVMDEASAEVLAETGLSSQY